MNKKIIIYNFSKEYHIIKDIINYMKLELIELEDDDLKHQLGYFFDKETYHLIDNTTNVIKDEPMLIMGNLDDEEVEQLLAYLRHPDIPKVPIKAVLTDTSINWSISYLYDHLKEEYKKFQS